MKIEARTLRLINSEKRQHGRCNITQRALLLVLLPILIVGERKFGVLRPRHDKRDLISRVRRVWRASLEVLHLLRVPVVRRDEQRVSCLLTCSIYSTDRLVRMRDRLNGSVEHARVADLRSRRVSVLSCHCEK